nr:exocyst complex component EXO70E2-like [Tanacetum cinerariifolium]
HLNHLPPKDKKILTTTVNQWTRQLVIRQRVEDFQLRIESYQTQLNLTKPQWDATGFEYKHDYTVIYFPRAVIFRDNYMVQMMRFNEIHKFSDGTLHQIDEALDYIVKEFRINMMNPGLNTRFRTRKDVDRCKAFMLAIQRRLRTRRIFRNLESFVGGRVLVPTMGKIIEIEDEGEEEEEEGGLGDVKGWVSSIQEKIPDWEGEESMIWDCDPEEAKEYLKTVDEARRLGERIEEDFRHMLVNNRQSFEPEHMSFHSSENDDMDLNSVVSFGDDFSVDDSIQRDSISRGAEVYIMDLINPQVILDLRSIANLMFDSNYGRECSQTFISARKDALDDCLFILEVEKLSIEDVLKMEWVALNSRIRRWTKAIRIFVRVYLSSEKFLCEQIFGQNESMSSMCFCESSKASILQLLNFAEAIAIGPHQPEKLLRILDMYEALVDLMPDIEGLYSDETGSYIKTECEDVLKRVGDCVKATFIEFESAVGSNTSNTTFPGGGNQHLTRYVMNYIKTLTDYNDSLNACLRDDQGGCNHLIETKNREQRMV